MYGWMGKILRVDLTCGTTREVPLDEEIAKTYIGGRGLGARIVFDEVRPGVDPLSAENRVVIASGPLTGTQAPTSGRFSLSTKSPLTGAIHDSNAGGSWGVTLKKAGYDAIVIQGRADAPVYLEITESGGALRDARDLWGQDTKETVRALLKRSGKGANVLCIGPAGENLVRIASICVDGHRALARGGVGAVLGSKNLKAIVVRGDKKPAVKDREMFEFARYESQKWLKANPITSQGLPEFGTSVLVNLMNASGILPTRNFQQGQFEHAYEISGEEITDRLLVRKSACWACPIACARRIRLKRAEVEGPEYESVWALGAECGISDLEAVAEANLLCNKLGIDTISAGVTIGCLMEMSEKGIIDYPAKFGDAGALLDLLRKIACCDGIGDELAEGSRRFAAKHGAPELAMQVKGLELPAYDPRGMKAQGLAFATSNRGACHLRANMLGPEVLGIPKRVDRFASRGKAGLLIVMQNSFSILDSLSVCKFASFAIGDEFFARLLTAATGVKYSAQDLQIAGERIWNLERLYNLREGFSRKDDTLPGRILSEPVPSGPTAGQVVDLGAMLDEYYRSRGWDQNGVPTRRKLVQLGLEEG
ncbi:MAG: aldehyde ferredoxin oxidoreductase family protein [Bacillota bacterium]